MNAVQWLTSLVGIPLKGNHSLPLPNGSKDEALKFIHDPYLLAAMNPLISERWPCAMDMKRLEKFKAFPDKDYPMFTVAKDPGDGFLNVEYLEKYGFGPLGFGTSGSLPFTLVAKDISPTIVEVRTRGPFSLRMVETYTIHEDRVERKVVVPRYWHATNLDLANGFQWNEEVWRLGPDGEKFGMAPNQRYPETRQAVAAKLLGSEESKAE